MIKSELIQKIAAANQHLYHRDIERIEFRNRNDSWKKGLPPEVVTTIEEVQAGELSKRGYA